MNNGKTRARARVLLFIFAKLIKADTRGDGDVEGFFLTEHGDGDDSVGLAQYFSTNALDFVADDEGAG